MKGEQWRVCYKAQLCACRGLSFNKDAWARKCACQENIDFRKLEIYPEKDCYFKLFGAWAD